MKKEGRIEECALCFEIETKRSDPSIGGAATAQISVLRIFNSLFELGLQPFLLFGQELPQLLKEGEEFPWTGFDNDFSADFVKLLVVHFKLSGEGL